MVITMVGLIGPLGHAQNHASNPDAIDVLGLVADRYASVVEYSCDGWVEVDAKGVEEASPRFFRMEYDPDRGFQFIWLHGRDSDETACIKRSRLMCGSLDGGQRDTRRSGGDNQKKQLPPATAAVGEPEPMSLAHALVNDVCGLCLDALVEPRIVDVDTFDDQVCVVVQAGHASAAAEYRFWIGADDYLVHKVACDLGDAVGTVTQVYRHIHLTPSAKSAWTDNDAPADGHIRPKGTDEKTPRS